MTRNRATLILGGLCVFVLLVLQSCETQMSQDSLDKPVIIRLGHGHTEDHSYQIGMARAAEIIERESNGKIKMAFYPEARLGSERQMQNMVAAGTLEMTITGLANKLDPAFALFDFPFLYDDRNHIKRVMDSDLMQEMVKPFQKKGLRVIGLMEVGFRNITANKPIQNLKDLAGFSIRVPESPAQMETFKALGATPVPMSFNELYGALRDGVVEGQENPLENIYNAKLYEVQKYLVVSRHIYNFAYVFISEAFWQTLSETDRQMISRAVKIGCNDQIDYLADKEKRLEEILKEQGMRFVYPDRGALRRAAMAAYESDFVKKLEPRASHIIKKIRSLETGTGE